MSSTYGVSAQHADQALVLWLQYFRCSVRNSHPQVLMLKSAPARIIPYSPQVHSAFPLPLLGGSEVSGGGDRALNIAVARAAGCSYTFLHAPSPLLIFLSL